MNRAGSVGDRQLAGSDVLDIRGIGGLGAPVGDGLKTRHLGVHRSGIGRYGGEIRSNLRFGIARDRTVLHADIEHQGKRPLRGYSEALAKRGGLLLLDLRMRELDGLKFLGAPKGLKQALPRLEDGVADWILYGPRPLQLRLCRGRKHVLQRVEIVVKDARHDGCMSGEHVGKERLQSALADVPLEHAVAHPHAVEIAREAAETTREACGSLERAAQREAALPDGRTEQGRRGRRCAREKRRPGLRAGDSVGLEPVGYLEGLHGRFDSATEHAVYGTGIEVQIFQPLFELAYISAGRAKLQVHDLR